MTSLPELLLLIHLAATLFMTGVIWSLLAVIWISTALVQVPCHNVLQQGFDVTVHRRLVRTNWVRTLGWSLRGLLVSWMAYG